MIQGVPGATSCRLSSMQVPQTATHQLHPMPYYTFTMMARTRAIQTQKLVTVLENRGTKSFLLQNGDMALGHAPLHTGLCCKQARGAIHACNPKSTSTHKAHLTCNPYRRNTHANFHRNCSHHGHSCNWARGAFDNHPIIGRTHPGVPGTHPRPLHTHLRTWATHFCTWDTPPSPCGTHQSASETPQMTGGTHPKTPEMHPSVLSSRSDAAASEPSVRGTCLHAGVTGPGAQETCLGAAESRGSAWETCRRA